ncbi:hypothetical protein CgIS1_05915 [Frankia sp. CgS1]|nr:hypothetical protein CgIS1_05915 [Frankia sp. CgIS1]
MRFKPVAKGPKLADDAIGCQMRRHVEHLAAGFTRPLKVAGPKTHRGQGQVPEGPATNPVGASKLQHAGNLALGSGKVTKIPQANGGLSGQRCFVEWAQPLVATGGGT